jgi:starvation-inducible outer membrane lipoprotein
VISILKILVITVALLLSGCALHCPAVDQDNPENVIALPIIIYQSRIVINPYYRQSIQTTQGFNFLVILF